MTEKEKMLAGEYYDPSSPGLVELRMKARLMTEQLNLTVWATRLKEHA